MSDASQATAQAPRTVIAKHIRDGWQAETRIPFNDGSNRELEINTGKSSFARGLVCHASVSKVVGNLRTHAFGLGGGGDFSTRVFHNPDARATEKTVRDLHMVVDFDALLARAKAHYAPNVHPDVAIPVTAAPAGPDA